MDLSASPPATTAAAAARVRAPPHGDAHTTAQVRTIIADLMSGESALLAAIAATYAALGETDGDVTHLSAWRVVLAHWARAMQAAYVLRATPADRQTFRENVKLYVTRKAEIRAGITIWYDWQLYSVMTDLFDRYESLMAISQEGMEACQKRNNMLMRLSNNFANAGRIPWRILTGGRDAVRSYLQQRAANKKSPERWLWLKNLLAFVGHSNDIFARVDWYKKTGPLGGSGGRLGGPWERAARAALHLGYRPLRRI